jgi:hypothetical protein
MNVLLFLLLGKININNKLYRFVFKIQIYIYSTMNKYAKGLER